MRIRDLFEDDDKDSVDARRWLVNHLEASLVSTNEIVNSIKVVNGELITPKKYKFYFENIDGEIPFQIDKAALIWIKASVLTSFKGFPKDVDAEVNLSDTTIKSFDGFPESVNRVNFAACTLPNGSLSGLFKHLKIIKDATNTLAGVIRLDGVEVNGGLLQALNVDGFKLYMLLSQPRRDIEDAVKIINKYAGQGKSGIVKAQRELLEQDLDHFAED